MALRKAALSQDCAERFQGFAAAVCDRVAAAPVKHLTDGGIRKSMSRLIGRRLLMRLGSGGRCESCAPILPTASASR
jgi:hypothetical protein